MTTDKRRKLRVELPNNLDATYANAVIVGQTSSEIVMDFTQIMPNDPRARIKQRIIMTPIGAKAFLGALKKHIERYEEKYGEIKMPPTLADQLFSNLKIDPEDDDE
jgi:hypothetical protein